MNGCALPKCWREYPVWEFRRRLAQWYADRHNHSAHGIAGGWIRRSPSDEHPIAQGWADYYCRMRQKIWAELETL